MQASPRARGWLAAALFLLSAAAVAPAGPAAAQTALFNLDPVCSSPDGVRWFEVINDSDTAVDWEAVGVDNPAHRHGTVPAQDVVGFSVHLPGDRTTIRLLVGGERVDEDRASDVECSDPWYVPPPHDGGSAPAPTPAPDPTPSSTPAPSPSSPTPTPTPRATSAPPTAAVPAPPAPAHPVPPVAAVPTAAEDSQDRPTAHEAPADAPPPPSADPAAPPADPAPPPADELVVPVLPDEPLLPTATPQPVVVAPEDGDARVPGWMVQAAAATVVGMGLVLVLVRNPADPDGHGPGGPSAGVRVPGRRPSPGSGPPRRPPPPSPGAVPPQPAPPSPGAGRLPGDPRRPPVDGERSPSGSRPQRGARPWEAGTPRHPRRRGAPPALPERRTGDWTAWEHSEDDGT